MAYTLTIGLSLGSSQTGLTLSAQLVDTAGSAVGSAVTSGFVEIGAGNYEWTYASFPDAFRGGVKFSSGATLKAFTAVNPSDGENADVKVSTREAAASFGGDVQSALTTQGYTTARAPKLDNLDATVSSRLAAGSYTAPPSAATVAGAVWDEPTSSHITAGSFGAFCAGLVAAVWAAATRTLTSFGALAASIWGDTATYAAGSKGDELAHAGAAGDPMSVVVPGTYAAGTAGYIIGHIDPASVTVQASGASGGRLALIVGDTYQTERGTALSWTLTSLAPDLTSATLTLQLGWPGQAPLLSVTGALSGPPSAQVITFELTSAQTTPLPAGTTLRFAATALWADTDADRVTLVEGPATLQALS